MWPLNDPDIALTAALAIRIPSELVQLYDREAECVHCLAHGMSLRDISQKAGYWADDRSYLSESKPRKVGTKTGDALIGLLMVRTT